MCTAVWITISVLIVPLFVWTQCAQAAESCSRVISYFLYPYQGSRLNQDEWRILDPSRGIDTLFLSLPGGFEQVRWDTTFQNVYFSSGDSIYSAQWRLGAKPRFIIQLPTGDGPWWLDSNRGCWEFLRLREQSNATGKDELELSRKGGELWESDGGPWRLVRADSVDLIDEDKNLYQWSDATPVPMGTPAVTLHDLASQAWEETWWTKSALFDTATVTATKRDPGDSFLADQWFFLGLESNPRRGIAYRFLDSTAPEGDWSGVWGPIYFVDLDRRTKTLLGDDESMRRSLTAEHCGFVLIPGVAGNPLVIDSSGRRVFSPTKHSYGAVWVPHPRE